MFEQNISKVVVVLFRKQKNLRGEQNHQLSQLSLEWEVVLKETGNESY